jgi:hypothetical protein
MRFQRTPTHIREVLGNRPNAHRRESPVKNGASGWPGTELNRRHEDFQSQTNPEQAAQQAQTAMVSCTLNT